MVRWVVVLVCVVLAPEVRASGEFTEVAGALGVAIEATSDQGPGCGFADIDGNGRLDIMVVDGLGDPNVLFKQVGPRVFQEVGATAGVDDVGWGKSVTFADYDNDGDPDLLLTRLGAAMVLYRNDGGTFTNVSASAGFAALGTGSYTGAAWADYDNDGWVDVYITRYSAAANRLMRNLGNGTFVDVAPAAGVTDAAGYGFQPAWLDYDNDGDQDLYVSNDIFGSPNALFRNEGNGTFVDVSVASGAGYDISAMGIAVGDYDNNGFLDLYVANIATGNIFLVNNGDGTFSEQAAVRGIDVGEVCWGVDFLDYDHDGWLDLYVNVSSDQYRPAPDGAGGIVWTRPAATDYAPSDGEAGRGGLHPISNRLYRGVGGGFVDVTDGSGVEDDARSFCSAVADYDADGDLDIYVTNWFEFGMDRPTALLENNHIPRGGAAQDWLRIELVGTASNRDGIGARVWIDTPIGWQMREHHIGTSYLGSGDPFLHFGTAGATTIPRLFVLWPSGLAEEYTNVAAGQVLTLVEGDGVPTAAPEPTGSTAPRLALRATPNPVDEESAIEFQLAADEGRITLVDATGRTLQEFRFTGVPGATARVHWDGRDELGSRLPAGRYFVVARSGAVREARSLTLLR